MRQVVLGLLVLLVLVGFAAYIETKSGSTSTASRPTANGPPVHLTGILAKKNGETVTGSVTATAESSKAFRPQTVDTDDSGNFSFDLPPGTYDVKSASTSIKCSAARVQVDESTYDTTVVLTCHDVPGVP